MGNTSEVGRGLIYEELGWGTYSRSQRCNQERSECQVRPDSEGQSQSQGQRQVWMVMEPSEKNLFCALNDGLDFDRPRCPVQHDGVKYWQGDETTSQDVH